MTIPKKYGRTGAVVPGLALFLACGGGDSGGSAGSGADDAGEPPKRSRRAPKRR